MPLCVTIGLKTTVLAANLFTLSWQHSVEHTEWREDWRVTPAGLQLIEARVKGSGAGIDPPEGSVLADGWWVYRPDLPVQERVVLAASGATATGWRLCSGAQCQTLGASSGDPVMLEACDGS